GYYTTQIHNVRIFNTQLLNGATAAISWSGQGTKDIEVGWLLDVTVKTADGSAAPGASVQVFDQSNKLVYSGIAGTNGLIAAIPLATTRYQKTGRDPPAITTTPFGGLTVKATSGTKKGSTSVNLTGAQSLTIVVN